MHHFISSEHEIQCLKLSHSERIQISPNMSSPGTENEMKNI